MCQAETLKCTLTLEKINGSSRHQPTIRIKSLSTNYRNYQKKLHCTKSKSLQKKKKQDSIKELKSSPDWKITKVITKMTKTKSGKLTHKEQVT